jgi:hypothetical protein
MVSGSASGAAHSRLVGSVILQVNVIFQRISERPHNCDGSIRQLIKIFDGDECVLAVRYLVSPLEQKQIDKIFLVSEHRSLH